MQGMRPGVSTGGKILEGRGRIVREITVLKKTLNTFTANVAVFIFGLLQNILIARVLGPPSLGKYYLIVTATAVISGIANLGFNVSNSTLVAKDKSRTAVLFTHSVFFSAIIGMIVLFAFYLGGRVLSNVLFKGVEDDLILLALLPVPLSIYASNWGALLVGLGEISFLNKYSVVTSLLALVASSAALVVFKTGLKGLLYVLLAYNAILALYGISVISKKRGGNRFQFDLSLLKESTSLGFVAHLGTIAHVLFQRMDFFIVNYFLGDKSLGYYGLATSIAEKIWMMISPVYSVSFARITGGSFADSTALVSKLTRGLTFVLLVLSFILIILGRPVIQLMFGDQFLPAYLPMVILLPGVLFFGIHFFLGLFFIGHLQKPRVTTLIAWIGLVFSLPLYLGLISRLGIRGAAIASSAAYTFIFLATFVQYNKATGQRLLDVVVPRKQEIREMVRELYNIILLRKTGRESRITVHASGSTKGENSK
jgi:O-antigen/teichoic acid export membrane protein